MLSSTPDFFISGTTQRVDTAVRKRIGEILIERGKVDAAGLDRALRVQQESGEKLGSLLVTLGVCAQRDVTEALALQLGLPLVAIPNELDAALERLYGAGRTAVGQIIGDVERRGDDLSFDADVQQLKDLAAEAPVIRLVSLIITNALDARASDIHIEPFENRLIVRYRIDGVLHEE